MTSEEFISKAENQSILSMFENSYSEMYTEKYDNSVERLLYYDFDKNKFGLKDDEQSSYRRAFESQNNVKTFGYVSAETAFTSSLDEIVEQYLSQFQS